MAKPSPLFLCRFGDHVFGVPVAALWLTLQAMYRVGLTFRP